MIPFHTNRLDFPSQAEALSLKNQDKKRGIKIFKYIASNLNHNPHFTRLYMLRAFYIVIYLLSVSQQFSNYGLEICDLDRNFDAVLEY